MVLKKAKRDLYAKKLLKKSKSNIIKSGIFFVSSEYDFSNLLNKESDKLTEFIPTSRTQIVSIGTSLIPFLEHNDANRALMGSNMQRQAVPLMIKQKPLVNTGIESIIVHNNSYNTICLQTGIIKYVSKKKLIVHENIKTKSRIDSCQNDLSRLFLEKKKEKLGINTYVKFIKRTYKLKKMRPTIHHTILSENLIVKRNEWVKKTQILTDSTSSDKGKLSLGKNILIAYMPWKGYNFEDAIVISERLVRNDTFTSIHIKKYKTFLINNETGEVHY